MPRGIKYTLLYIIGLPLILLSGLIEGDIPLGDLTDVKFWIVAVICYHVFWALFLYFGVFNRRRFIALSPWISSELSLKGLAVTASFALFLAAWVLSLVFILISLLPSVWVFAAWVVILLVAIYFWFYRGISIYENGKLRVFQGRISTIRDGWVDEIRIERCQDYDILHLTINGRPFAFKLPEDTGLSAAERVRDVLDDIADYGFSDDD